MPAKMRTRMIIFSRAGGFHDTMTLVTLLFIAYLLGKNTFFNLSLITQVIENIRIIKNIFFFRTGLIENSVISVIKSAASKCWRGFAR